MNCLSWHSWLLKPTIKPLANSVVGGSLDAGDITDGGGHPFGGTTSYTYMKWKAEFSPLMRVITIYVTL